MAVLVVLPGLDGTATLHADFVRAASTTFDSVAVIPYPQDQMFGYVELEAIVRSTLPSRPFVLLGESFSGPIALSIAANPPSNLVGLVLSTTFATSPVPLFSVFAPVTRIAPVRALPLFLLSWWLLGRWATPQLEAALQDALSQVSPKVLRFRAAAALRANVLAQCSSISVPVLNLCAANDRLLSRSAGSQIEAVIPNCETTEIAGPHLLLQAAPQVCAQVVGGFASRVEC